MTELVARPLLNLHWPQLAGFVQPLGGEYAARRSLLEQLPFPVGYGVELGLLVDALHTVGLDALAQVDVGRAPAPPPGRPGAGPDGRGDLPDGAAAAGPRATWCGPTSPSSSGDADGFEPRTCSGGHRGTAADGGIPEYAARRGGVTPVPVQSITGARAGRPAFKRRKAHG